MDNVIAPILLCIYANSKYGLFNVRSQSKRIVTIASILRSKVVCMLFINLVCDELYTHSIRMNHIRNSTRQLLCVSA